MVINSFICPSFRLPLHPRFIDWLRGATLLAHSRLRLATPKVDLESVAQASWKMERLDHLAANWDKAL